MRSMDIQSIQTIRSTQGSVDLLIEPDAAHIRIDNYAALDTVEVLGYQAARQALASWERTKYSL